MGLLRPRISNRNRSSVDLLSEATADCFATCLLYAEHPNFATTLLRIDMSDACPTF